MCSDSQVGQSSAHHGEFEIQQHLRPACLPEAVFSTVTAQIARRVEMEYEEKNQYEHQVVIHEAFRELTEDDSPE